MTWLFFVIAGIVSLPMRVAIHNSLIKEEEQTLKARTSICLIFFAFMALFGLMIGSEMWMVHLAAGICGVVGLYNAHALVQKQIKRENEQKQGVRTTTIQPKPNPYTPDPVIRKRESINPKDNREVPENFVNILSRVADIKSEIEKQQIVLESTAIEEEPAQDVPYYQPAPARESEHGSGEIDFLLDNSTELLSQGTSDEEIDGVASELYEIDNSEPEIEAETELVSEESETGDQDLSESEPVAEDTSKPATESTKTSRFAASKGPVKLGESSLFKQTGPIKLGSEEGYKPRLVDSKLGKDRQ